MTATLYYSPYSQHSRRVLVLKEELGIELELQNVGVRPRGTGGENDEAWFLKMNPNGKVPVLKEAEAVIWESNAIMWYLAEVHGDTPLWPKSPAERAQICKWQVWQAAHLTAAVDGLFYERVGKKMMGQPSDPKLEAQLSESFLRWAAVMSAQLEAQDYLALNRFTCADIACASAFMHAEASRIDLDAFGPIARWFARISARESWKRTDVPPIPQG